MSRAQTVQGLGERGEGRRDPTGFDSRAVYAGPRQGSGGGRKIGEASSEAREGHGAGEPGGAHPRRQRRTDPGGSKAPGAVRQEGRAGPVAPGAGHGPSNARRSATERAKEPNPARAEVPNDSGRPWAVGPGWGPPPSSFPLAGPILPASAVDGGT